MKRYVALARVSSREQEREGFSLDVQEDAVRAYAQQRDGRSLFWGTEPQASDDVLRISLNACRNWMRFRIGSGAEI